MKINIGKTLKDGAQILLKNPIVFVPLILMAVINYFVGQYTINKIMGVLQGILPGFAPIPQAGAQEIPGLDTSVMPEGAFGPLPSDVTGAIPSAWDFFRPIAGEVGIIMFISSLVTLILWLMTIKMLSDAKSGKPDFMGALALSVKKFIPVFISGVLCSLAVLAGTILLIIPGIYLMFRFIYYPFAAIVDNQGIVTSLGKSWQVTRGNWWRTVGLVAVFSLISIALSLIVSLLGLNPLGQTQIILQSIITFIVTSYIAAGLTLAYLQARETAS